MAFLKAYSFIPNRSGLEKRTFGDGPALFEESRTSTACGMGSARPAIFLAQRSCVAV
jgi:hypothetical protein